jgi:cytochrome b6-f complex iron-sulfur subunit
MNRRNFLIDTTCKICLAGLAQTLVECSKENINIKPSVKFSIDLTDAKYANLKTVGGVVQVSGVYIICTAQSAYLALSSICTHAGCNVNYNSSGKDFVCPCHGGVYDINGKVVSGPPPAPLAQYQVAVSGSTLSVS